jgi:hypothetical protein
MSCRINVLPPDAADDARARDLVAACPDLLAADRRDEFRWLARAWGIPEATIERLWRRLRATPPA